jgi:endonuclease/exonuclease/phosphatase family metal-dependent hydrolase
MPRLRLLTYNIHKGFGASGRTLSLEGVRDAIRSAEVEIVFLQEVRGTQFEYLADTIWDHYAYGKNAVTTGGDHGNAILSKFPFISWENIDVSNSQLQRRGLLHGVIEIPEMGRRIDLICLHLDLFQSGRERQVERLCNQIEAHIPRDHPLVVAGDFNDWNQQISSELRERLGLEEAIEVLQGEPARTFPIWMPLLPLDRIYVRGLTPRLCARYTRGRWRRLSDHAALWVELEF